MNEFVDHLHEVFSDFGRISIRSMFGGFGIYHDGVMFALVANDVLYMKADDSTSEYFESRGLGRFQYNKGGKVVNVSYYEAPVEVFDEPGAAVEWARLAHSAALRGKARSTGTTKR